MATLAKADILLLFKKLLIKESKRKCILTNFRSDRNIDIAGTKDIVIEEVMLFWLVLEETVPISSSKSLRHIRYQ